MAEPTADALAAHGTETRRDFLRLLAVAGGAIGVGAIAWPLIDALNPDAAGLDAARPVVLVSDIAENATKTVQWGGQTILIRRLTDQQLAAAQIVPMSGLVDPQEVSERVAPDDGHIVVVIGMNTGAPCALQGSAPGDPRGDYGGWVSPCDGSEYDALGRVRAGPAPRNLAIPRFRFIDKHQLQLG